MLKNRLLFKKLSYNLKEYLYEKSKNKILALPEGEDPRIVEASKILKNEFQVQCILGSAHLAKIQKEKTFAVMNLIAEKKEKILSEKMKTFCEDSTFAAGATLTLGEVDAVVSGCCHTTGHIIRAALSTVGLKNETKIITSAFLLSLNYPTLGGEDLVLYSDCAVIPKPTSQELCSIALLSSEAYQSFTNKTPLTSFLSFSTQGSASHSEIDIVKKAYKLFSHHYPHILCEGEVQFDTACVPDVCLKKNPGSKIKGRTNVFIFPDLSSGNIGYKMTQYIGGAQAWGPILLGTAKPFSDLSRGSSVEDIVQSAILTLSMSS